MARTRQILTVSAVAAVAALGAGAAWMLGGASDDAFAQCRGSQVAGGDIGGPFTLVNGDGETVTDADVITEPSLIYFGYTYCPDVCPLDTARNALAVDLLAERGMSATPIFISVDPARDTPDVVDAFAENMHERMIGLTGSAEQVRAASRAYKTYYNAHDEDGDPYYLVDHSTFTYLVLPDHGFVEFFRRETSPEEMADTVACYISAAT